MNKNIILTAAMAGLMLSACASTSTSDVPASAEGECHGVNSCKGKGECGGMMSMLSGGNSCAGKNSCKGKGWVKLTKSECDSKSGTFKKM